MPVRAFFAPVGPQGPIRPAWASPAYDARGNMTTVPQPASPTATFTCWYDPWNRLVAVRAGQTDIELYQYDGSNRRVSKATASGENWVRTDYYYNLAWQTLEERKATQEDETAVASAVYAQYVWSVRYIDAAVLRDRDSDGDVETGELGLADSGLDERLYYLNDANMNVTAVVDTAGAAVERYLYDPYGQLTVLDGSTNGQTDWATDADGASDVANEILYCGSRRDPATGLDYVRHRYRHPGFGWISRDWLTYADGLDLYDLDGPSLYAYSRNNPMTRQDIMGLCSTAVADTGFSLYLGGLPQEIDAQVVGTPARNLFDLGKKALVTGKWANYNLAAVTGGGPQICPYKKAGIPSVVGIMPFAVTVPVCEADGPCSIRVEERGTITWRDAGGVRDKQIIHEDIHHMEMTTVADLVTPVVVLGERVFNKLFINVDMPSAPTRPLGPFRQYVGFDMTFTRTVRVMDGNDVVASVSLAVRLVVSAKGVLDPVSTVTINEGF